MISRLNVWPRLRLTWRILVALILVAGASLVAWQLFRAWTVQARPTVTCEKVAQKSQPGHGLIELELQEQHPIEPTFGGRFHLLISRPLDPELAGITVTRSGTGTYLQTEFHANLYYNANSQSLHSTWQDFSFVTQGQLHRDFPLDSSTFDFELSFDPPHFLDVVRVINRVPGFTINCDEVHVTRKDASTKVTFELRRNLLIQLFALVLAIASVVFLILVLSIQDKKGLATAVASYFFSLWSLRGILSSELRTFPTLFDAWIITICVVLLVGLLLKQLVFSKPRLRTSSR